MTAPDSPPPRVNPAGSVTIRCREDGPLVVEMPSDAKTLGLVLRVTDHLGREFPLPDHKPSVALCRCGHSADKPFCDGTHRDCGFKGA